MKVYSEHVFYVNIINKNTLKGTSSGCILKDKDYVLTYNEIICEVLKNVIP